MSTIESVVGHAEAWVQEELGSQKRLLALLAEQERAVTGNDTAALLETTAGIEREIDGRAHRNRRLAKLIDAFGAHWGIAPAALTLGSICERLGERGARLARLRAQLVDAMRTVSETGRRMVALARLHQGVLADLVRTLAGAPVDALRGAETDADDDTGGRLLLMEA